MDVLLKDLIEAVRLVLDKVVADGEKEVKKRTFNIREDQLEFVKMLKTNNYDINKIIDKHVQRMNTMMIKKRTRIEADFPGFSGDFGAPGTPSRGSRRIYIIDDKGLSLPSDVKTATDFTSAQAREEAEAQEQTQEGKEEAEVEVEAQEQSQSGSQAKKKKAKKQAQAQAQAQQEAEAQDKSTGQKSTPKEPKEQGGIKDTAAAVAAATVRDPNTGGILTNLGLMLG